MNRIFSCIAVSLLAVGMAGQVKLPSPAGKMISVPGKQSADQSARQPADKQGKSQQKPAAKTRVAPKLTVSSPDTVVMGETFDVIYYLEAPGYMHAHIERSADVNLKGSGSKKGSKRVGNMNIATLTVFAHFTANVLGECILPPFMAEVAGKTCSSQAKTVYVKPEAEYEAEYNEARRWLAEHAGDGIVRNMRLSVLKNTNQYILFGDVADHGFVLVARQQYWPYAGQPVLAYSTEYTYAMDQPTKNILKYYALRLETLASLDIHPNAAGRGQNVAPLLGRTAWGQTAPYNNACAEKDGKRMLTGCMAVAVGQIMRYHALPGSVPWGEIHDRYEEDDHTAQPVAELLAGLGDALQAQYGMNYTSTSLEHFKPVMTSLYGYSPRLTVHYPADVVTVQEGIRKELQAGRPVLAANMEHAFVVDGCDGMFLHLNMGWEGHCNGWYNPLEADSLYKTKASERFITGIVTGIMPRGEKRYKEVQVQRAGELKEMLSEEEQLTVTHLKVSGKLSSEDVILLRRMAGAVDDKQPLLPTGSLTNLDLSGVHWVNDRIPFYRERMTGKTTIQTTYVEYEVSEMAGVSETSRMVKKQGIDLSKPLSNSDWEKFEEATGVTDGMSYHRDGQGYVWTYYTTFAKTISPMMFRNCTSLREVILPSDTRTIGDAAFVQCECLERIDIPAKVTHIGKQAFSFCGSLTEFLYHKKNIAIESPNFESTPRDLKYIFNKN